MENKKILGIDIGGTKIHIGVIENGKIIQEKKFSTSADGAKEEIISELIAGIAPFISADLEGIGIGVPGLVDEAQGIIYDLNNIPAWKKVHLKKALQDHFKIPVFLTNDANCFILGEKVFGKAQEYNNVVGLSLGTGLGGGIIIDNKLYSGILTCAGEIGGIPYLDASFENYCSGKFFKEKYGVESKQLLIRAEKGDEKALKIFRDFGKHLGNAIKVVLFMLSPEAIILGGSVCKAYSFFKDAMLQEVETFPFKGVTSSLVIKTSDMENSALFGAVAFFIMSHHPDNSTDADV